GGLARNLVGFVAGSQKSTGEIIARCRDTLPSYMVPSRIHRINDWPLNANGKTDYESLTAHPALGRDFTPSPTARRAQTRLGVRARSARKDARVDRSRPCERQPSIVRPDRKTQLTDNGTSIDPLFHSVYGYPEFPLAIADRPLTRVETCIFRQESWMEIQVAPFEQLESVRRNNEGAVGVDEPPARLPGQPLGFSR